MAEGRTLLTGAAGWTAQSVIAALTASGHSLIGVDIEDIERGEAEGIECVRADVADLAAVEAAFGDTTTAVVHLAVAVRPGDYGSPETPFRSNVLGSYNVFEAARRKGVCRVVAISSAPVHLSPKLIAAPTAWKSSGGQDHLYDLTKRLQEEIARDFAETFGVDVVVLRAGHIVDGRAGCDPRGRPLQELTYCRGGWVCRYDLATAVDRALTVPLRGFHIFNIIGASSARARFDVGRAERELGFVIAERFEAYDAGS